MSASAPHVRVHCEGHFIRCEFSDGEVAPRNMSSSEPSCGVLSSPSLEQSYGLFPSISFSYQHSIHVKRQLLREESANYALVTSYWLKNQTRVGQVLVGSLLIGRSRSLDRATIGCFMSKPSQTHLFSSQSSSKSHLTLATPVVHARGSP